MKAMVLSRLVSLDHEDAPLELVDIPVPEPKSGEVRLKVSTCGVCHTELDEIEGRTAPPNLPVVLGHEVVGRVDKLGKNVTKLKEGDRVGVGWIHSSTGKKDENISAEFQATGRDVNGGYAEYMTVPEDYAYPIPAVFSDAQAAPLLCAGGVGYRALKLTGLKDGERLGLNRFRRISTSCTATNASSLIQIPILYVFARDKAACDFALELGAVWTGDTEERAPEPLQAIIDTTPAWKPIVEALANLRCGWATRYQRHS